MTVTHFEKPTEISSAMVIPGMNIGILEAYTEAQGDEDNRRIAGRVKQREGITVYFSDGSSASLFPQLGTAYVSIWGLPDDIDEEDIAEYFEETLQELEQLEPEPEPESEPEPEPEPVELHPEGIVAIIDITMWDAEGVLAQWSGEEWLLIGTSDTVEDNLVNVQYYARFVQPGEAVVSIREGSDPDRYREAISVLEEYDLPEIVDNLYEIIESMYN